MNKQLEHRARIERYLAEGRTVSGGTNSTTIITDLGTVITNISTTQQNRGTGGSPVSGVILDPTGMVSLLKLKAQEMKFILNYLLYGNMNASGSQQGSSAIFQSGDSNNANTGALLVGVYNDLS
jgi:hypothetical protein